MWAHDTNTQTCHVLTDTWRSELGIIHVQSFGGSVRDTGHSLVVEEDTDTVCKQGTRVQF
jgi:hypothetical protein